MFTVHTCGILLRNPEACCRPPLQPPVSVQEVPPRLPTHSKAGTCPAGLSSAHVHVA
jgi:hypothetical protein